MLKLTKSFNRYFSDKNVYNVKFRVPPGSTQMLGDTKVFSIQIKKNDIIDKDKLVMEIESDKGNLAETSLEKCKIKEIFVEPYQSVIDGSFLYSYEKII